METQKVLPYSKENRMIEVRAALILLASAICGVVATALRLAAGASWPDSLLVGGAASGTSLGVLMLLVSAE